jgi:hypothetical protein
MSQSTFRWICKSKKYKGVALYFASSKEMWRYQLTVNGTKFTGLYETEKEAAIAYDMKLIDNGKRPVNVLTLKTEL